MEVHLTEIAALQGDLVSTQTSSARLRQSVSLTALENGLELASGPTVACKCNAGIRT